MHRVWAIGLVATLGCSPRDPGRGVDNGDGQDALPPDRLAIETFASPLEVVAGDVVTVGCVVRLGSEHLSDELTGVRVVPAAGPVAANDRGGFNFSPTTAGTYRVRCYTEDGSVEDESGVSIDVLPASPARVETELESTVAAAGAPVAVTCDLFDTYGNRLPVEPGGGLDADAELLIDSPLGASYVVRGTVTGDYAVTCRHGSLVDPTPAVLTVVAGMPGASEVVVEAAAVQPEQWVNASCSVTDAWGNPVEGVTTELVLLTRGGTAPAAGVVTQSEDGFAAREAGTYYVFCRVAGCARCGKTPAEVRVLPGNPCTWVVDALPQDCYWQGRRLPVDFEVFDFWGNRIEEVEVLLAATAAAAGVIQDGPNSWVVAGEGDHDLEFSLAGDFDASRCSQLDGYAGAPEVLAVRVDSTGPAIDIQPARAAVLVQDDIADTPVLLSGTIADAVSTIASASVNGTDLGADGTLTSIPVSLSQSSRWGTTIVTARAEDACGNRSVLAQSFVRSGDTAASGFFAAATAPDAGARAAQGILVQLNQDLIDDYDRSDLDDIASIGEVMLESQDFNDLVPPGHVLASHTVDRSCNWSLSCGDTWAETEYLVERDEDASRKIVVEGPYLLSLEAIDGGLRLHVRVGDSTPGPGFEFPLRMWARDRSCFCGAGPTTIATTEVKGIAYATQIDVTGTMAVTLIGGVPQVSAPNLSVSSSGLGFDMSCDAWIDWLCDWIADTLVDQLSDLIEDAIADAIRSEIPPLVEELLGGFSLDSGFEIPAPLNMRLEVASGLDWILFCGPSAGLPRPPECPEVSPEPGFGQIGLYTQIYPTARGAGIPVSAPGAIRKGGGLPVFDAENSELGFALRDDTLNQILWALWYGGGLDIDSDQLAELLEDGGVSGVEMSISFATPPLVMPGRDGREIEIGVGDVYLDATVDLGALLNASGVEPLHVGLYLSTILGGSLDINDANELVVSLDAEPQIFVEAVEIGDAGYQAEMSELLVELLALMLPDLLSGAISSFPIPEIDLSGIADLPSGTDATWVFDNPVIERQSDHYAISGSLQ
jgi:hypothetical protein